MRVEAIEIDHGDAELSDDSDGLDVENLAKPLVGIDDAGARCATWRRACFMFLVALALGAMGMTELVAAEHERQYGWTTSLCRVTRAFSDPDSLCVFYGIVVDGDAAPPLCAVPGAIAARTDFHAPPACHAPGDAGDATIAYWRDGVAVDTEVECLVPTDRRHAVPLTACVAAASGSNAPLALVYRTWTERLVYTVRTPKEGRLATESITSRRTFIGLALVTAGGTLLLLAVACVCPCRSLATRRAIRHRRD